MGGGGGACHKRSRNSTNRTRNDTSSADGAENDAKSTTSTPHNTDSAPNASSSTHDRRMRVGSGVEFRGGGGGGRGLPGVSALWSGCLKGRVVGRWRRCFVGRIGPIW